MHLGRQEMLMNEGPRPSAPVPVGNQESFFFFFFFRWCPVGVCVPHGHFRPTAGFWCVCEDETGTCRHPSYGCMLNTCLMFVQKKRREWRDISPEWRHVCACISVSFLYFSLLTYLLTFFTFLFFFFQLLKTGITCNFSLLKPHFTCLFVCLCISRSPFSSAGLTGTILVAGDRWQQRAAPRPKNTCISQIYVFICGWASSL